MAQVIFLYLGHLKKTPCERSEHVSYSSYVDKFSKVKTT